MRLFRTRNDEHETVPDGYLVPDTDRDKNSPTYRGFADLERRIDGLPDPEPVYDQDTDVDPEPLPGPGPQPFDPTAHRFSPPADRPGDPDGRHFKRDVPVVEGALIFTMHPEHLAGGR